MISVIIPTYERPIELTRAIKSVLNQVNVLFELLIINDSDNEQPVLDLLDKFNDKRILYFRNERTRGGNGARNTGIIHSKGEFIAFLDDDDEWYPTKLEEQFKLLKSLDYSWGAVYCGFEDNINDKWIEFQSLKDGNIFYEILSGKSSANAGSTLFIRKSLLVSIGLFDEELSRQQDLELLARFFRKSRIACVNKVLVKIYGHNETKNQKDLESNKILFLDKIKEDINQLPTPFQNKIYAFQYRELSLYFAIYGNNQKSFYYFKKSLSYSFMFPTRYLSIFLYILKNKTGINTLKQLDKVKLYIFQNKVTQKLLKKM